MRYAPLLVLVLAPLAFAAKPEKSPPDKEKAQETMKNLDGVWQETTVEVDGKKLAGTRRWHFNAKENTVVVLKGQAKVRDCQVSVEGKSLNLREYFKDAFGFQTYAGIFELDGDNLKICLSEANGPEPTEMKSVKNQCRVYTLKRVKKK
jgi:uncharacterized protein (TIGR03067 family)